jgi:hypothetical protein
MVCLQDWRSFFARNFFKVVSHELGFNIVSAEPENCLGQVVSAETEEVSDFGDLVSSDAGSGNFNHRPNHVVNSDPSFSDDLFRYLFGIPAGDNQLIDMTDERDFNLGLGVVAFLLELACCLHDGLDLHSVDFWEGDAQSATSVTEHGVVFVQPNGFCPNFLKGFAQPLSEFFRFFLGVGQEFVQGWSSKRMMTGSPSISFRRP